MKCCQCEGIENLFDESVAADDLRHYREDGPAKETRLLLQALKTQPLAGMSLLDIGGGVGAIQHELVRSGVERVTNVDASPAYLAAARGEAERLGYAGQATYHHGDFVDLAPELPPADIVTLDRVICCYHDMPALVSASAARANKLYGLVFPRSAWWLRAGVGVVNLIMALRRDPMRFFIHPTAEVEALLQQNGLQRTYYRRTFFWQVMVYARP